MKRFGRRLFLQGFGGALIGLPLLEYTHNTARADATKPVPRHFAVFFEHGGTLSPVSKNGVRYDGTGAECGVDGWAPADPGEALVPGDILQPLSGHVPSLLLLRGVDNAAGRQQTYLDGDHGYNNATALTCADASLVGGGLEHEKSAAGPSIDRVLGDRLAQRHPVPFTTAHLMVDGYHYGSPFYRSAHQQVAPQKDPVAAFASLFSGVSDTPDEDKDATFRARALRKSVLDGTKAQLSLFQGRLGAQDRITLEAHLDSLRELEQRVAQISVLSEQVCIKPSVQGPFATSDDLAKAHVDILVAALRCGLTNVVCLELGDVETLWMAPPFVSPEGNAHAFHHLSMAVGQAGAAHADHDAWVAAMIQNRQWRMSLFARFLDGLAAVPDGDGTLLDRTVAMWTSEFSNGGAHSGADVPLLLASGTKGRLRGGRHLNFNALAQTDPGTLGYSSQESLHNVYTALLNLFDFPDAHFGNNDAYRFGPTSGLS